jgi:hypothetical protein
LTVLVNLVRTCRKTMLDMADALSGGAQTRSGPQSRPSDAAMMPSDRENVSC